MHSSTPVHKWAVLTGSSMDLTDYNKRIHEVERRKCWWNMRVVRRGIGVDKLVFYCTHEILED